MAWEMKYQPNVVLDFDGVIHSYVSGWQGVDVVPDPPVPLIGEEIKRIRAAGYRVVVVSTRCATPEGMGAVRRYLRENGIEVDDVAAEKPPAKVYVDDRALLFDGKDPAVPPVARGRASAREAACAERPQVYRPCV